MRTKATVTLIYSGNSILGDGSPEETLMSRDVEAFVEDKFSQYYYRQNNRLMQKAINISIPRNIDEHLNIMDIHYQLMYVEFKSIKYQIKEILAHKKTSMLKILDCEEVAL